MAWYDVSCAEVTDRAYCRSIGRPLSTSGLNRCCFSLRCFLSFTTRPQSAYKGKLNYTSSEYQFYVYQTMPLLPSNWSTFFDIKNQMMYVELEGSAGLCGSAFNRAKREQEYGVVVEDDIKNTTIIGPDDNLIH